MPWERVTVTGVKAFVGDIDGQSIDSGKVFIQEALDDSRNDAQSFAQGFASVAYPLGSSVVAKQLRDVGLEKGPITLEVEFRRVTNGKTSTTKVVGFRPIAKAAA